MLHAVEPLLARVRAIDIQRSPPGPPEDACPDLQRGYGGDLGSRVGCCATPCWPKMHSTIRLTSLARVAQSDRPETRRLTELTATQCELSDVRFDELDIEGVLSFAEHVLGNLTTLWLAANVEDRCRLQITVFPTGLVWDGERFGTAPTNGAFSWLRQISEAESSVASPTGFGTAVELRGSSTLTGIRRGRSISRASRVNNLTWG